MEQLDLTKLKVEKNGGLSVEWEEAREDDLGTIWLNHKQVSQEDPHPDLWECLHNLEPLMQDILKLEDPDRIHVTGVSISGGGDLEAVTLSAKITTKAGIGLQVNTHRVKYDDYIYGMEDTLKNVIDSLKSEAHAYVHEGKRAQLKMAFDEEAE